MNRRSLYALAFLLSLFFAPTPMVAQTVTGGTSAKTSAKETLIKGYVFDKQGEALIGVTVQVEGTRRGVMTDTDGFFEIKATPGKMLKFSYVGFEPMSLKAQAKGEMKVVMKEMSGQLEEVVVNGYFTRNKNTYTGAVKTITNAELVAVSPTNILQGLSSLDAGLNIQSNNAQGSNPNALPDIVVRSTTSLATSNEVGLNAPMIIIDGVESTLQALYDINVQDIERVDILKDASATALYGENAANGVIVIERKKVTEAPVRVRYTFTPDFKFADLSSTNLCNAEQKLELERLAGLYDKADGSLDQTYFDRLAVVSSGRNIDWISKPVRNSFSQTHSLSVTGRGSGLDYNFTTDYSDNNGVMKDDGRQRYNFGVYLNYRIADKLVVTLRAAHNNLNTNVSKYGSFSNYILANPYDTPYDEFGNLAKQLSYNFNNPLYEASLSSFFKTNARSQDASITLRYNFRPNLYVTAQGSWDTTRSRSDSYTSPDSHNYTADTPLDKRGSYTVGNIGADNWTTKIVGNWIHDFDNQGTMFTLNLGWEVKKNKSTNAYMTGTGFLADGLSDIKYATAYSATLLPSGGEDLSTSVGGFAAGNFVYKNRYVVDGSYRLSGSSKFGANKRVAPFWSAGLGYNMHNESFMKDLGWFDILRIRSSYGHTGSVKFNSYQAISTYFYSTNYLHYAGVGAIPKAMANPDLSWQTTKKFNVGITSTMLNNRFNINLDYYKERTDDMLIDVTLPPSSGATSVKNNFGKQDSQGLEFSLWGQIVKSGNWGWNLSFNGLHSQTKILNISDALKRINEANANANYETAPRLQFREGESPTAIYAVRSAGVDPASGKEIFIRKDGSYTYEYSAADQVAVGDLNPWLQGTMSSTILYKDWSLNANFSYRFGGDMYNSTRMAKVESIDPRRNADVRAFLDRWKQPGDVKPYLGLSQFGGSYAYSDRFVEKDNELWLSNISIQYNVPTAWVRSMGLERMYLSAGASDLFRITTAKYERGTDYPFSRGFYLSASVTF